MVLQLQTYVVIDGNKYPVVQGTYVRKWARAFSSQLAGSIIRLNFIDRGPGIRVYDFTVMIQTWKPGSIPYANGITAPWYTQAAALEASYAVKATAINFIDPLGQVAGPDAQTWGVYFTNLNQIIPQYSTPQQTYLLYEVEVTEATQVVA